MLTMESHRFTPLALVKGQIAINEDGQKFRVTYNLVQVVSLVPYDGKKQPTFFCYMGAIPNEEKTGDTQEGI